MISDQTQTVRKLSNSSGPLKGLKMTSEQPPSSLQTAAVNGKRACFGAANADKSARREKIAEQLAFETLKKVTFSK